MITYRLTPTEFELLTTNKRVMVRRDIRHQMPMMGVIWVTNPRREKTVECFVDQEHETGDTEAYLGTFPHPRWPEPPG